MKPTGTFGPRGGSVTVVQIDWLYTTDTGLSWTTPAPITLLNRRPHATHLMEDVQGQPVVLVRDLGAEADALDKVWDLNLQPVPASSLQWRSEDAALQFGPLWSLQQEDFFADFWAEELPRLQALGWRVVVRPGFAHESVPVDAWHLILDPATGEVLGKEVATPMHGYAQTIVPLGLPAREGSWLLSLGVEIDGQIVDLVPMLANLLRRDARWSDAKKVIAIDDLEVIQLRAPGGKRIDALAAPLKAIVTHMLED
jgi:uncharacterized iron-regulated membrane protein